MSYEGEVYMCRAMRSLGRKGRFGGLDRKATGSFLSEGEV
jgi:hypothetical protein